jgi:NAD(P)-dependent dehydrogenase (short-subunit alcohol dehydrogenase family)
LLYYSSTKRAIISFTRSLSQNLAKKGIRVNAVAPGPIWTPLIPSTFPPERTEKFGKDTPMGRAGEPYEVAPAFLFLASPEASYITGETVHVNGGDFVNG